MIVPGALVRRVQSLWRGQPGLAHKLLSVALVPAAILFCVAVSVRNWWHDRRRPHPPLIPVVSVGNLTVGGTGKTPVARWLCDWFAGAGARAALVTRGYGKDEVALYEQWLGADAVFVDADRAAGVRAAHRAGYQVAILDDGFQHRQLARTLDILLISRDDPTAVRMLPAGPYREPLSAANRASVILVTGTSVAGDPAEDSVVAPAVCGSLAAASPDRDLTSSHPQRITTWKARLADVAPNVPVQEITLRMGGWKDLAGTLVAPPTGDILAVCAIARPHTFAAGLKKLLPKARIDLVEFTDHHQFRATEIESLVRRAKNKKMKIVCTAKDAVKLSAFPDLFPHCLVLKFTVVGQPDGYLKDALIAQLRADTSIKSLPK